MEYETQRDEKHSVIAMRDDKDEYIYRNCRVIEVLHKERVRDKKGKLVKRREDFLKKYCGDTVHQGLHVYFLGK